MTGLSGGEDTGWGRGDAGMTSWWVNLGSWENGDDLQAEGINSFK